MYGVSIHIEITNVTETHGEKRDVKASLRASNGPRIPIVKAKYTEVEISKQDE